MRYSYLVEGIPVIRPSERDAAELIAMSKHLAKSYKKTNVSVYLDRNSIPRLGGYPLTDDGWMDNLRDRMLWYVNGWNFDPGTTANIYLRKGGVGAHYLGRVVFMKEGVELGFEAIGGNRYLLDYYRDMAKLGIYIP